MLHEGIDLAITDDLSFADYVSLGSGGNPGEQLQIDHFHEVDRDEFGDPFGGDGTVSLQSFYIEQSMLYNVPGNRVSRLAGPGQFYRGRSLLSTPFA